MSQRVETSARALVLTQSSHPENGHLWKNATTCLIHIQGENENNTMTVFFSFVQHTSLPLVFHILKGSGVY